MYGAIDTLKGKKSVSYRPRGGKEAPPRRRCCQRLGAWCHGCCDRTQKTLLVLGASMGLPIFYMTFFLLLSPGLSTLAARFHPSTCTVSSSVALEGRTNCTWSSCRQGCTAAEIFRCWQVFVFVQVTHGNDTLRLLGNLSDPLPSPARSTLLSFTRNLSREGQVMGDLGNLTSSHAPSRPSPTFTRNQTGEEQVKGSAGNLTPSTAHPTSPTFMRIQTGGQVKRDWDSLTPSPALSPTSSTRQTVEDPENYQTETYTKDTMDNLNFDDMGFLLAKGPGAMTRLQINVEGCGYLSCEAWWLRYGRLGSTYTCYLSADGRMAVPEVDLTEAMTKVVLGMLPLVLATVAVVVLYVLYSPRKPKKRQQHTRKQQELKWKQARDLILRQVEREHGRHEKVDPILVRAALAKNRNQVAPSNLAKKGEKKETEEVAIRGSEE